MKVVKNYKLLVILNHYVVYLKYTAHDYITIKKQSNKRIMSINVKLDDLPKM